MPSPQILEANRRNRQKHVQAWKKSGKSLPQYARENGINIRTFYDWCKKNGARRIPFSGKGQQSPGLDLVAVPLHILRPVEENPVSEEKQLSIEFGKKFRIVVPQDFSPGLLGRVIKTLEEIK